MPSNEQKSFHDWDADYDAPNASEEKDGCSKYMFSIPFSLILFTVVCFVVSKI